MAVVNQIDSDLAGWVRGAVLSLSPEAIEELLATYERIWRDDDASEHDREAALIIRNELLLVGVTFSLTSVEENVIMD